MTANQMYGMAVALFCLAMAVHLAADLIDGIAHPNPWTRWTRGFVVGHILFIILFVGLSVTAIEYASIT